MTVWYGRDGGPLAELAWVVGVPWQGRGLATEAVRAVVSFLRDADRGDHGADPPGALGSAAVAGAAGLAPTGVVADDGEVLWRWTAT